MCDDVADYLEEAKLDSDDGEAVLNIVEDTFLDLNFETKWKPYRVELVKNKHLETEFEGENVIWNRIYHVISSIDRTRVMFRQLIQVLSLRYCTNVR